MIRVLFLGDIIGSVGRKACTSFLREEKVNYDLIIANGENIAGGYGLTPKTAEEIFSAGVDVITSGNHLFDKKEVFELSRNNNILKPANMHPDIRFNYYCIIKRNGVSIAVTHFMGRLFMNFPLECPFRTADKVLSEICSSSSPPKIKIVDFHAEATSEKMAMGFYLAGRVSAVCGTHTHVQTSDERIISGTGYITDVGMVGSFNSVIGMEKNSAIKKIITGLPKRLEVAEEDPIVQGVILEIDDKTGNCIKVERLSERITQF